MAEKLTQEKFQEFVIEQFTGVRSDITEIRSEIKEIKDILKPLARAVDTDAETIVEHGNRLTRVEKHMGLAK